MRGILRTCDNSSSAARRGESTLFRVKKLLVHSSSRLTVHGPATELCMRRIVGEVLETKNRRDKPSGSLGWCERLQGVSASQPRGIPASARPVTTSYGANSAAHGDIPGRRKKILTVL